MIIITMIGATMAGIIIPTTATRLLTVILPSITIGAVIIIGTVFTILITEALLS
jgi:hypothetical protein